MPWHNVVCETCGKTFTAKRHAKQTPPRFCSRVCQYSAVTIVCPICGKTRRIKPEHVGVLFTCGSKECTKAYKWHAYADRVSERIGEPLETAILRRYVLERMSYREIAAALGINFRTVMRTLKRLDVEPRRGGDAVATQWENNNERREAIGKAFAKAGKERVGPKNPRWRGGGKYDHNDDRWFDIASKIRERDGFRCTRCGRTDIECREAFGRTLAVHHIVPFRLTHDHSPSNLRTLCASCHSTIENEFLWLL